MGGCSVRVGGGIGQRVGYPQGVVEEEAMGAAVVGAREQSTTRLVGSAAMRWTAVGTLVEPIASREGRRRTRRPRGREGDSDDGSEAIAS